MKELLLCVTMKLDLLLYFLHWVIVWLRRFKLYLIDILLRGRCSLPWPAGGSSGDMLPGDCGWLPLEERFKSETVYKRIYHHQVDLIFSYTRTNVRVNHLIFPGFCQRQEKCKIRGHGERGERGGRGRRGKRLRKRQFCVQRSWQLVSFRIKVNWDCNVYSLIISLSIPFSHHVCFAGIHSEKLQPWSILLFHCTRS